MDHATFQRFPSPHYPNQMSSPDTTTPREGTWLSLWVVAFLSLVAQLALCGFFSFGQLVPMTIDVNPSNLWVLAYHFPPSGMFLVLNWLGVANPPLSLNPYTLASNGPAWLFLTSYAPILATCALLTMAAFLRELELPRPAALFGGVLYAWQGDLLPFVFPGHFAYITTWPFFAIAAWGALRAVRTSQWPYAVISGAGCGMMVELPSTTDRGAIASLLIAALFLAPVLFVRNASGVLIKLRLLVLCVATAFLISLASFLALFQSQIESVKMGGQSQREETYKLCTQFSLGPAETLTYLIPGFFGWHINSEDGPYWGWIGRWPGWEKTHHGSRNMNLAISTTGTVATVLALIGAVTLLPGRLLGPVRISERSRFYGRVLLVLGAVALVLSWGDHTPFYRPLFALPLMDKWRNPLKWLEMTNFALVTLSALGVQHLLSTVMNETPEVRLIRRRLFWFCGSLLGLLVFGGLAYYLVYPLLVYYLGKGDGYDPETVANMMDTLKSSLHMAILMLALFCLLLYGIWRPDRLRAWTMINPLLHRLWQTMLEPVHLPLTLACGLMVLSVAQLGWVATKFIQLVNLPVMVATNPLLEELKSEGDRVRVSVAVEDPILNILLLNQFSADNISCLDISAASRIPDDLTMFFNALRHNRQRLWFLAGVKNVAVPQDYLPQFRNDPALAANIDHADGYTLIPTSSEKLPSHALIGMKDYLRKVTFIQKSELIDSDKTILDRLADPAWNPRESVLLNPHNLGNQHAALPSGDMTGYDPSKGGGVEIKTYNTKSIDIQVRNSPGGWLLINDRYDPDWHVQVNGKDSGLFRADFIMRAVAIPAGDATVTMNYATHYRVAGLSLPANLVNLFSDTVMLAAWIVAGLALRRRQHPVEGRRQTSLPA